MKKYTSNQQLRRSNGPVGRYRIFKHTEIDRANLFEGLPYVQFDAFIRRDRTMQHVVIRDLLKIIMEKCNQLKNLLLDKFRLKRIFLLMDLMEQPKKKGMFNQRLEDTIVLIDQIGSIILQEFKKNPEQIGLKQSPIKHLQEHNPEHIDPHQEEKVYDKNVDLFNEMLQYLRDRIELYMLMMRQAGHKILDDQQCMSFLKDVTALRYNLLQLSEDIRVLDANSEENLKLIKLTLQKFETVRDKRIEKLSPEKKSEEQKIEDKKLEDKRKKIEYIEKNLIGKTLSNMDDQAESEVQKKRAQRLNELLQQKFNFNKSSIVTRESKLILNQDKLEQEKVLLLESSQKASKIKHDLVDNRKRLALEKLKDPTKDPQLRGALEIMTRVLNINIQDQFQE
ncbi:unnamed protein product (macronuclear) [Paramecium tetraurelia]|uniref:Dynein regulatory complex protein 10 n=1 Tax=Paramecium tetraurelia TaxID=5888 RepID=A0D1U9_PARTE|nr:uncharacterized protein GSPATT00012541001 [Paramecium tetraurelia]CAK77016.1 unnamed protein product [Paramecium tetraurelia]|eukprot:XP_001444413.1 hypothetical protein (macronuclear) [Paramecium tetraurelia strain d4-2]